jgi:hypothetical protein
MYYKIVRIFVRCVGGVWIILGSYGILSAIRIPHDRATTLFISLPLAAAGIWLVWLRKSSEAVSGDS